MSPHSFVRVVTVAAAAILAVSPGFGQGRGGATSGSSSGGSTGGGAPATAPSTGTISPGRTTGNIPNTTTPGNTPTTPTRPVTLFITGRVMIEDGSAPSEPVTIERICPGSTRTEGYTDSKGYFGIEVGNETGVFQDASETANMSAPGLGAMTGIGGTSSSGGSGGLRGGMMSDQRYSMCDLRARLAGYRSQTVSLANRRPMDDPNIGVILLHREGKDEGSMVSAVSLAAPKDAKKAFDKGMQAGKKGKIEDAEKEFQKAVELYPQFAAAWNELGRIQLAREQKDIARASFFTAIKADPKFVGPYLQLSVIAVNSSDWKTLAEMTDTAVRLDPFDYPQAYLFNAVAKYNMQKVDEAEKSIRQAEKLDTQHTLAQVPHLIGLIEAYHHDYAAAAEHFKQYLKMSPDAPDAEKVRAQLAQAEKLVASAKVEKQDKEDK